MTSPQADPLPAMRSHRASPPLLLLPSSCPPPPLLSSSPRHPVPLPALVSHALSSARRSEEQRRRIGVETAGESAGALLYFSAAIESSSSSFSSSGGSSTPALPIFDSTPLTSSPNLCASATSNGRPKSSVWSFASSSRIFFSRCEGAGAVKGSSVSIRFSSFLTGLNPSISCAMTFLRCAFDASDAAPDVRYLTRLEAMLWA
mmetsp:Transcript_15503/g.36864  ORF Transcript_15503/g.36864 Transcript_15503/m.36864 type:complete len:203 (-) Transcript_15503:572-1180(-)